MNEWKRRLTKKLEPVLRAPDPRPKLSAYNDMPYAIFQYPPKYEFALRAEAALLKTRLEQGGKRVSFISLAACLADALEAEEMTPDAIAEAEQDAGLDAVIETIHEVLSVYRPLDQLIAAQMPPDQDPCRDIVFITRAGALFPFYRISPVLDKLQGKVRVPTILFYPGEFDGASGLIFMGVLGAEHNYRAKIY